MEEANFGIYLTLVAAFGGLGWTLAVACMFRKFDRTSDRIVCLASDVFGVTFAAMTFVGVVTIAVRLPDIIVEALEKAEMKISLPTLEEEFLRYAEAGDLTDEKATRLVAQHMGTESWMGELQWHSFGRYPLVDCYFGEVSAFCLISERH